jgi:hypothetical protein
VICLPIFICMERLDNTLRSKDILRLAFPGRHTSDDITDLSVVEVVFNDRWPELTW